VVAFLQKLVALREPVDVLVALEVESEGAQDAEVFGVKHVLFEFDVLSVDVVQIGDRRFHGLVGALVVELDATGEIVALGVDHVLVLAQLLHLDLVVARTRDGGQTAAPVHLGGLGQLLLLRHRNVPLLQESLVLTQFLQAEEV